MSRETIRDKHNQIVGYLHHEGDGVIRVTDQHQTLLGRAKPNGTFDEHNQLISHQKSVGFLFPEVD